MHYKKNWDKFIMDFYKFYENIIKDCLVIFSSKLNQYGLSWSVFRTSTIIDHIYIKLHRIKYSEEHENKIEESIEDTLKSVINYSLIGLFLIKKEDITIDNVLNIYKKEFNTIYDLIKNKNNDYDNIWKDMFVTSFTDIMLCKILRSKEVIKNKSDNKDEVIIDALMDIVNYSILYLYRIKNI